MGTRLIQNRKREAGIGTIHAAGMDVTCTAARPIMKLPVLVNLEVFRRRIGSNPKGFSTTALFTGVAASRARPVRDLRRSTNVNTYNAYAHRNLLRKHPAAPSIDHQLAEEKSARICRRRVGRKEQAARGEQDVGRALGWVR